MVAAPNKVHLHHPNSAVSVFRTQKSWHQSGHAWVKERIKREPDCCGGLFDGTHVIETDPVSTEIYNSTIVTTDKQLWIVNSHC